MNLPLPASNGTVQEAWAKHVLCLGKWICGCEILRSIFSLKVVIWSEIRCSAFIWYLTHAVDHRFYNPYDLLNEWIEEDRYSGQKHLSVIISHLSKAADMWKWEILSVIGVLSLTLFLIAVCYILYSGLTTEINIKTGLPPVRGITIAYKYKVGLYKDCASVFKESSSIGPNMSCIGIFYDDPKKVR